MYKIQILYWIFIISLTYGFWLDNSSSYLITNQSNSFSKNNNSSDYSINNDLFFLIIPLIAICSGMGSAMICGCSCCGCFI